MSLGSTLKHVLGFVAGILIPGVSADTTNLNRAENSHLPLRKRERAMLRFRQTKTLQKFASVYANVHNHFSHERHLVDRQTYKTRRSAAMAEWQILGR